MAVRIPICFWILCLVFLIDTPHGEAASVDRSANFSDGDSKTSKNNVYTKPSTQPLNEIPVEVITSIPYMFKPKEHIKNGDSKKYLKLKKLKSAKKIEKEEKIASDEFFEGRKIVLEKEFPTKRSDSKQYMIQNVKKDDWVSSKKEVSKLEGIKHHNKVLEKNERFLRGEIESYRIEDSKRNIREYQDGDLTSKGVAYSQDSNPYNTQNSQFVGENSEQFLQHQSEQFSDGLSAKKEEFSSQGNDQDPRAGEYPGTQHSGVYPLPGNVVEKTQDEYFASYDTDYGSQNANFSALVYDGVLFPNPEMMVYDSDKKKSSQEPRSLNGVDILPDVDLPDNSLADADLKERSQIDSVQFVYYGGERRINCGRVLNNGRRYGGAVVIGAAAGGAFSALTAIILLYKKKFRSSKMFPIEMNLLTCFLIMNAAMVFSVQDTRYEVRCEVSAVLLHYLHLVCAAWILVYCYVITDHVTGGFVPNLRYNYLFAYGVPAVLVLFFYAMSLESYETRKYCWMSLEKGMLLGFMLPAMALIVVTTGLATQGVRALRERQRAAVTHALHCYLHHKDGPPGDYQIDEYVMRAGSLISLESVAISEAAEAPADKSGSKAPAHQPMGWNHTAQDLESFKVDLSSLSMDNLSWKTTEPEESSAMRACLCTARILQPAFLVMWFVGVVALDNDDEYFPPIMFALLWTKLHMYMCLRLALVQPYIPYEECLCVEGLEELQTPGQPGAQQPATDTIPLLVATLPDSISTITN